MVKIAWKRRIRVSYRWEYVDIRNISTQDLIKIRDKSLEEEYKLNLQDYDF